MKLLRHDWDFSSVSDSELVACVFYEYARESRDIRALYNGDSRLAGFPSGLTYTAKVGGILRTLPNPFVWAWFKSSGEFGSTPWLDMSKNWRDVVSQHYGAPAYKQWHPEAFISGDSPFISEEILSRGDSRDGIDQHAGRERIVVEIDWAGNTDANIVQSFSRWISAHRPQGVGKGSASGTGKNNSWSRKLDNLGCMRLLHDSTLSKMMVDYPEACKKWPDEREWYKKRDDALNDFHELFPFLSLKTFPIRWRSIGSKKKHKQVGGKT